MTLKKLHVTSGYFEEFKAHMDYFVDEGTLQQGQAESMLNAFEVQEPKSKGVRFISAVTAVGAVLFGLGILSYIASNWDHFTSVMKVGIILFSMTAFYITGTELERTYVKVGKALQYIAVFIFGGGLFLVDQTYNLNLNVADHFALWILGILPMVWFNRDYLMTLFGQILTGVYIFSLLEGYRWYSDLKFYGMFGIGVAMTVFWYAFNETRARSQMGAFINNILPLALLISIFGWNEWNVVLYTVIMLAYGAYLFYKPVYGLFARVVTGFQGVLFMGIAGFMLSFEGLWEEWSVIADGTVFAVAFSIAFIIYLFWLTRQGIITSLVFICIFILRFYFDTFYQFLPKSVFFMIGGGILIGFGYYLERVKRRKGEMTHDHSMES